MVVTQSMHDNEMEKPGDQEVHRAAVPVGEGPGAQHCPGKQHVSQDDSGSSTSRPPNPNPGHLTAIEEENA